MRRTFAEIKANQNILHDFTGWNAHSWQVRVMLGLDAKAKLPAEGMEPRVIQGIKVWVKPLIGEAKRSVSGHAFKRSSHRVVCECPACGKEMSVGRLHQHVCKV